MNKWFVIACLALLSYQEAGFPEAKKDNSSVKLVSDARCKCPERGPPGPQGPSGAGITAFGSFYSTQFITLDVNDPIPFENQLADTNIGFAASDTFTINETGFYYIHFGVANHLIDGPSSPTVVSLVVNGSSEIAGSRLNLPELNELVSIAIITLLQAGDTLQVINQQNELNMGITSGENPVTSFLNIYALSPSGT